MWTTGLFFTFSHKKKSETPDNKLPSHIIFFQDWSVVQSAAALLSAEAIRAPMSPSAINSAQAYSIALATSLTPLDMSLPAVNCHGAMEAISTDSEALAPCALIYSCD